MSTTKITFKQIEELIQILLIATISDGLDPIDALLTISALLSICPPPLDRPLIPPTRIDFHHLPASSRSLFRFDLEDLFALPHHLLMPATMISPSRDTASSIEVLAIVLRRLARPCNWDDLVPLFGRSSPALSRLFYTGIDWIYFRWSHLLMSLQFNSLIPKLPVYAQTIVNKGSWYDNIFGMIDGTFRPIARPTRNQESMYSGYKKSHGIHFQGIMFPDGIIGQMWGPFPGPRHDSALLSSSALLPQLQMLHAQGHLYSLYGDSAYPLSQYILKPWQDVNDPQKAAMNKAMSSVRVRVEHGFGLVTRFFSSLNFKQKQKILGIPVAKLYLVATILTNCLTCFYRNEVSEWSELAPPSIQEYLQ